MLTPPDLRAARTRARPFANSPTRHTGSYRSLIAAAYQYGFPLFEQARLTYNFSYRADNPRRVPVNTLAHARTLTGFHEQKITTPNNDTLYSSAAMDLSAGPLRLDVPHFGKRYYSVSLFDAYTNVFACIGTRLCGGDGGCYVLAGPGWRGQLAPGETLIRAPGNYVVVLVRIQADGAADYADVHRLQDSLKFRTSPRPGPRAMIVPAADDPLNFVAVVNQVLRESPPSFADQAVLETLACVGLGEDQHSLCAFQAQLWQEHYHEARSSLLRITQRFGKMVDGWEYTAASIGNFGADYVTRAVIGLKGFWANVPSEQTYTFALADADNCPLDGKHSYRFELPRARAEDGLFWSLSMYEVTPQGQLFFRDNVLHRYAIGSVTEDLRRNADGGVTIAIAQDAPADSCPANWLPCPPGRFALVMRVYAPRSPAALGSMEFYPPIQRQN